MLSEFFWKYRWVYILMILIGVGVEVWYVNESIIVYLVGVLMGFISMGILLGVSKKNGKRS